MSEEKLDANVDNKDEGEKVKVFMTDEESTELGAMYGRAFAVLKRAYNRAKIDVSDAMLDLAYRDPLAAITKMLLRATREKLVDQVDHDILTMYLGSQIAEYSIGKEPDVISMRAAFWMYLWLPLPETQAAAAKKLKISAPAVNKLIKSGKLKTIEVCGRTMIDGSSLREERKERGLLKAY